MTLEDRARLSYYQELSPINAAHGVMLVRHSESGALFVKKTLSHYQPAIFETLKAHPLPGMPRILEAVEDEGRLIVIESYISGRTLQEELDGGTVFSQARTLEIGGALCAILQSLHALGIIHRDIKPSNVMLTEEGAVKLLDMDAAKIHRPEEARDTRLIGTKGYAAPEQYGFGSSGPATDIYALGVLMNVLLTGAFPGEKMPEDSLLHAMIERCTRLEPAGRYASAAELLQAIRAIQGRPPAHPQKTPPAGPAPGNQAASSAHRNPGHTSSLLPPGFRSGNPKSMLLASLWYLLMIGVLVTGAKDTIPLADKIIMLGFTLVAFLGAPLIFYNYRNIWDRTGISKKPPERRRGACAMVYGLLLLAAGTLAALLRAILR